MGRLRATTAPSELDRAIAGHVDRASRELESATLLARSARGQSYRSKRVERDLARIVGSLQQVGTIVPKFDDPDRVSEEERNQLAREQREQAREQAREAAREPATAERGDG